MTTAPGSTSRVTTAPAPTVAPVADVDAAEDHGAGSERGAAADDRLQHRPVPLRLETAADRRPRVLVVHEHHSVPDEDLVLDRDALADERVTLHLAAGADHHSTLDLDERADAGLVADRAVVEVRERPDDHACRRRRRSGSGATARRWRAQSAPWSSSGTAPRLRLQSATLVVAETSAITVDAWASVIPGKSGSESPSRESFSATGNAPGA